MHAILALLQDPEAAPAASSGLATVDQVGLGLIGLLALLGIWRGLWWQVMRLAGLAAAVIIARAVSPKLGPKLESLVDLDPSVAQGIAWLVLFVAGLAIAALLGRLGKKSLEAMQLGLMDRVGGLVAGVATALLLFTSALVGTSYLAPEWTSRALKDTYSGALLELVSSRAPVMMDQPAAQRFQHFLDEAPSRRSAPAESAPEDDGNGPSVR